MTWEVLTSSAPYLAVLVYLLVNNVLMVLAMQRRREIELHNRVREAKLLRLEYLRSLEEREKAVG